jgi:AraC-like DNA-binding protein
MDRSTKGIDYQDVPRPVAALADDYPPGHIDPPHCHPRSQLIYSTTGVMTVTTALASYVLPPQRAVWVPAGMIHEAFCRGQVSCRTLYIDQTRVEGLPPTCRVIEVSDLLRELIVEATHIAVEYDEDGRDGRLMNLLLDEVKRSETAPLHVPMPQHPRLVKVCQAILQDPSHDDGLDDWADVAGMGRRTFTRTFRKDTGMSFAAWRQNVRLMEAVSRLAVGESVTRVALDVGYNSPSAFTAMFRRTFGVAPSHYLQEYVAAS